MTTPALPIIKILPELLSILEQREEAIVQAPPGAGKTTQIPISLLAAKWLDNRKILILEPRRLAAKAAANRMAVMLNEKVGQTVGYRVRHDVCVSKHTRIEVVTEGVFTRTIQNDPALDNIAIVIFDEFHERSLEADLGLALALNARQIFRDGKSLKILLMSATLDSDAISALLNNAPIIRSEGKMFPVEVHYSNARKPETYKLAELVSQKIIEVIEQQAGSILVFLPGQQEIKRVCSLLSQLELNNQELLITPLYGNLSLDEQSKAIEPAPTGKRKIVLATDIAETSLTINGVRVVIDAGLCRKPIFDLTSGMTRLETKRLSRSSSIQRMGRAGRTEAGCCYRLWSETQQQQLVSHDIPEILQADLVPLVLQLLYWGVDDPGELVWMNSPPQAAYQQALNLLQLLGAVKNSSDIRNRSSWKLTTHGKVMAKLPLHPRLAHMLIMGQKFGLYKQACTIAAILSERDPVFTGANKSYERDADIKTRIELLQHSKKQNTNLNIIKRIRLLILELSKLDVGKIQNLVEDTKCSIWNGFLIALAYPDRIAQQRQSETNEYRLSGGRAAHLAKHDSLQKYKYLAIAQAGSFKGENRESIYLAAPLDESLFENELAVHVDHKQRVYWDNNTDRLVAEEQTCIGKLVIRSSELHSIEPQLKNNILLEQLTKRGLDILPWTDELRQWQARVLLLRELDIKNNKDTEWPDVSDAGLLSNLDSWLGSYLQPVTRFKHFSEINLKLILSSLLDWSKTKKLNELAPEKIEVPSGSKIKINYMEAPPVLAVRLQEMFGCATTPVIANHKVTLKVHLLSPARRPLQVTQDLNAFWNNAYQMVKKEMKGRYPKHYWPDDPLIAKATRHTKNKPTN